MKIQYTRWQTQRRSLPDQKRSPAGNGWVLGKSCKALNLTYQIYNLGKITERWKVFLRLIVPKGCKFTPSLRRFLKEHPYIKVIFGRRKRDRKMLLSR